MSEKNEPTVAEAARLYAAAGWAVLPLHDVATGQCSCRDADACRVAGKHPRTPDGFHDATTHLGVASAGGHAGLMPMSGSAPAGHEVL